MIKNFNLFNESVTNFEDIPWKYYTDYKIKIYSLRGVENLFIKKTIKILMHSWNLIIIMIIAEVGAI